MRKWLLAGVGGLVVLTLVCCGAALFLRAKEKDNLDFYSLVGLSPWPYEQLLLPNELPETGAHGDVGNTGLNVTYPFDDGTPHRVVEYTIELVGDDGEPVWSVSCGARAVVVCTDLGDGYTLVKELDTDNSDPRTTVRRRAGDRVYAAAIQGDHPEDVDRLRRIITENHRPTKAELLRILRPDGYQTDWS